MTEVKLPAAEFIAETHVPSRDDVQRVYDKHLIQHSKRVAADKTEKELNIRFLTTGVRRVNGFVDANGKSHEWPLKLGETRIVEAAINAPRTPETNPFHKILTRFGFKCTTTNLDVPNRFKKTSLYNEFIYTNPAYGKSHVIVWMYQDDSGVYQKTKTWIFRHEQSNGIMSPTTGDTKGQLERALTRVYGTH